MHPKIMVMVIVKIMVTPQLWAPREGGFGGLHPLAVPAVGLHSLGNWLITGMSLSAGQVGSPEHNMGMWQCPSHLSLCPGGSGCDRGAVL